MSFDGIFTYGMIEELNETIRGGRIAKIHQPFKHELVFHIRANGQNRKLLLSAHPSYARVHLTNETYDNPSTLRCSACSSGSIWKAALSTESSKSAWTE